MVHIRIFVFLAVSIAATAWEDSRFQKPEFCSGFTATSTEHALEQVVAALTDFLHRAFSKDT